MFLTTSLIPLTILPMTGPEFSSGAKNEAIQSILNFFVTLTNSDKASIAWLADLPTSTMKSFSPSSALSSPQASVNASICPVNVLSPILSESPKSWDISSSALLTSSKPMRPFFMASRTSSADIPI